MFSYTEKFNRIDTQQLISNDFYNNEYQFFWEDNKSNQTMVGFGAIDIIEIFTPSDLNQVQLEINKKLNTIVDISSDIYIAPKFFGGYAFNIMKRCDNWIDFPRGYFVLHECIITSIKNNTFIIIMTIIIIVHI